MNKFLRVVAGLIIMWFGLTTLLVCAKFIPFTLANSIHYLGSMYFILIGSIASIED